MADCGERSGTIAIFLLVVAGAGSAPIDDENEIREFSKLNPGRCGMVDGPCSLVYLAIYALSESLGPWLDGRMVRVHDTQ